MHVSHARFRSNWRRLLPLLAFGNLGACSGADREGSTVSPVLTPVDSIVLAESDSEFVGQVTGFAALHGGGYLVADAQNGTLHEFDARGAHRRRLGQRGKGPSEWSAGPYVVFTSGDSMIVAADGPGGTRLLAYPSGEPLPAGVPPYLWQLAGVRDDALLFSHVDRDRRFTLERVSIGTGVHEQGGPYPDILDANPFVGEFFSAAALTWLGADSIAVAMQHSNTIFVGPFAGRFDTISVPAVARRGALQELLRQIDMEDTRTIERVIYKPSYPLALAQLPTSGLLALVSSDQTFVENLRMTGTLYLSLIDVQRKRVCPDAIIPAPTDPLPYVAFLGDTLLVLAQEIAGADSRTVVRRFVPSAESCRWIAGT